MDEVWGGDACVALVPVSSCIGPLPPWATQASPPLRDDSASLLVFPVLFSSLDASGATQASPPHIHSTPAPTSMKPLPCSFHKKLLTTWQNGQPERSKEQNAPIVNNVQVSGGSVETGPFITAGTYHIYCTVHQDMNLQINVQ